MIIKLVPIKTKARLTSVINYVATDKGRIEDYRNQGIFHNLKHIQLQALRKEFEHNYDEYAAKRSNGNIGMHIIQSVSPLDRDKMSLDIMDDITSTLLNKAYPNALAFGTHHNEQSHWHSHIIVSANELMSKSSTRLSKEKLFEIHKYMLDYVHEKYPELKTNIDISNWSRKLGTEKTYYMKKRNPDLKLTKEELKEKVQDIFRTCESSKQFFQVLEFDGFLTYTYKDRVQGIRFGEDDKKMRFSRLGIEREQFDELDKQYDRLQEIKKLDVPISKDLLSLRSEVTEKEVAEAIETQLVDKEHTQQQEPESIDSTSKTVTLDQNINDMNGKISSTNTIDTDFNKEQDNKQLLKEEFEQNRDSQIQVEEKNRDSENEVHDSDQEVETQNDAVEIEGEKQQENDIAELENEPDNDIDSDNNMDMDSEQ